ncbi:MAG TPA: aminopeptidase [Candidatus Eisenbergiella merdipullorum]|uniref:Aminopeptidase n=1 Tax=Candidatus Eisenbergiella merdipullorum TaxID=2838553 RepID=A0A9D2KZC1_9FIRM|nr:aminopeptidase [Candidatus Eisenbergiella merdipullorum]
MKNENERTEEIRERLALGRERLSQIPVEAASILGGKLPSGEQAFLAFADYFAKTAKIIGLFMEEYDLIACGGLEKASEEELAGRNRRLYADVLPGNYEKSYANPRFAVAALGKEYGQMLSFLAAEERSLIAFAYEQDAESMVIRLELFLEVYQMFVCAREEENNLPDPEQVKDTLYWFASDYSEIMLEKNMRATFDWKEDFARKLIMESDLTDLRYLYRFGEYITENERHMARYLNSLPEEKIALMADTFTEGYRIGFAATGKDITKKKSVNIRYFLGFERVVRRAVENFRAMGLNSVIYRAPQSILEGRKLGKNGYYGAIANKQFEYDHEYDQALFYDKRYVNHRLENYRNALESVKELAAVHGGPAVIEGFGEPPFEPEHKEEDLRLNEEQQKLSVLFQSKAGALMNEYVKGEERSFTIIAFPVPEIGDNFEEIFDGVLKINTLDYKLYQGIQQKLIDVLDQARYVRVRGMGRNRTDLRIALHTLADPQKETNFENCVADVNIPVGEVFTSPVLKGTDGKLHVTKVYLAGLKYLDLEIDFRDGMVSDYTCANFDDPEENRKFVRENVLYHHDTLPMGEFAIGTNTTAYVFAEKYGIADILPVLIAEKMGPHFAVGDTCYSHEEDLATYNPDGKRLIAKENEVSALRSTDPGKAYLNCHTDITIPYDELGELAAVHPDGTETMIIRNGRFVLAGCEELNRAFEKQD